MRIRFASVTVFAFASYLLATSCSDSNNPPTGDASADRNGGTGQGGTAGSSPLDGAPAAGAGGTSGGASGSGGANTGGSTTGSGGASAGTAGSAGASTGGSSGSAGSGGARDAGADMGAAGAAGTTDAGSDAPGTDGDSSVQPIMRDVLMVGNSVAGTVSFLDPATFANLGSINVIPDRDEVIAAINADLVRFIAYPIVKNAQLLHHFEPQAGDRFVDDLFVSPDGTVLYVSRSNLGDVAAFDLTKPNHPRIWRTFVDSPKADHATISPDGSRLIVSATGTSRVADVIDAKTGKIIGTFPTGAYPHQNDYSADGKFIYNSSIGNVSYQAVTHQNNANAGDRWLVKVDATTLQVVKTWVFEWGIRPNIITADGKTLYTQLSYLNGVVKYDLDASQEIRRSEQPLSSFALMTYANYDEYPHHSAHHGLAISGDGTKLCDCGTIDNQVAIVSTDNMQVEKMIDVGMVPYWATTGPGGQYCFVSLSGGDAVSVIDYNAGKELKVVPVGKFPQRSRLGKVPEQVLKTLSPAPG